MYKLLNDCIVMYTEVYFYYVEMIIGIYGLLVYERVIKSIHGASAVLPGDR